MKDCASEDSPSCYKHCFIFFPQIMSVFKNCATFLKVCFMEKKKQNKNKASPNYIFIAKKARYLLYFELRAYSVTYLLTLLHLIQD